MTEPFRVIAADPPWDFRDKLPGGGRGAQKHYATMTTDAICAFAVPAMAEDSLLFLWRVASKPWAPIRVAAAWGFEPKSEIVWCKTMGSHSGTDSLALGMGRYVRNSHETCLIATRGKAHALIRDHATRSVFFAPRGEHSKKPAAFYEIVEKLVEGPYVELFARGGRRPGWTQYGDELDAVSSGA
jgi:N6-adenosine-specific RNA methylase IME4